MPFEYKSRVQLYQTDSAGFLFYSKIFDLAFDAFSAFLISQKLGAGYIINESDYLMPYIHAEADYLLPLSVDEALTVVIEVEKIGETSFILNYNLLKNERVACRVKTAHVTVSKKSGQKMPLPEEIRRSLESLLPAQAISEKKDPFNA